MTHVLISEDILFFLEMWLLFWAPPFSSQPFKMLGAREAAGHNSRRMVLLPQNFGGGQCELPGRNWKILLGWESKALQAFPSIEASMCLRYWEEVKVQAELGGQAGSMVTDLVTEGWHWSNTGSRSKDGLGPACSPDSGKWWCRAELPVPEDPLENSATSLVLTET